MKQFCTNCGTEANPDMKFCSTCGQLLPHSQHEETSSEQTLDDESSSHISRGENTHGDLGEVGAPTDTFPSYISDAPPLSSIVDQPKPEQSNTPPPIPSDPSISKKPMTKGTKIGLSITVALVATVIIAHFIIQSMLDPIKKVDQIVKAYEAKDEAMFDYLTIQQGIIYEPQSFFQYYEKQGFTSNDLKRELLQALSMTNEEFYATVNDSNGETFGYIEPKKWLIYDTIDVVPNSYAWQANTDFSSLKLDVYGEEHTLTEELKTVGTFLVGEYEVTLQADDIPFGEKEMQYPVQITPAGEWETTFSAETFGMIVHTNIQHDLSPGTLTLLVNGEKSKLSWTSMDEPLTVPFFKSDKPFELQLQLEREKETIQSAKVVVDDNHAHFIELPFDSALLQKVFPASFTAEEAEQLIVHFREDFEKGLNFSSGNYIQEYFPPNSKIQNEYIKFVNDTAASAVYHFHRFDTSLLSETDDTFVFTSVEAFDFYDGKTTQYNRTKEYTVQIIDGQLYITDISIKQTNKS